MAVVITVDGPSGSGKGTLCANLSRELGFHVLDSGALYRIVGLVAHGKGMLDAPDEQALADLVDDIEIVFSFDADNKQQVMVNGEDVTHEIRTETVGGYASVVAQFPAVRAALLEEQREFAKAPGLIADGRDMGTVVFPEADLKIFLTASAQKRAQRRVKQLQEMGKPARMSAILAEIEARDARDTQRASSPLLPADDAISLDSSEMGIDDVIATVLSHYQRINVA